jgi:hypothetical protein
MFVSFVRVNAFPIYVRGFHQLDFVKVKGFLSFSICEPRGVRQGLAGFQFMFAGFIWFCQGIGGLCTGLGTYIN